MSLTPSNAAEVAEFLGSRLNRRGTDYALGGAIAFGYWGQPRGTIDVDVTLFVTPEKPSECVECLLDIGCEFDAARAAESLTEHGFCRVGFRGTRVDVFVPIVPFYESAKQRRKTVQLGTETVWIWDAESLSVFKMMFFRRKDIADVEQILHAQQAKFDHAWVRTQLDAMYGKHDPRLQEWDQLVTEI